MESALDLLTPAGYAWLAFVLLAAGFWHGLIGFGFPIVATPLLALVMDFKSAVIALLLPTLTVTVVNTFRGGNLSGSLGRFWFMPFAPLLGSWIGTRMLIAFPPEPFLLLLAAMLLFYLYRDHLGRADIPLAKAYPVAAGVIAGLLSGIFESTANVAMAPLLVYFIALGLSPAAMVQTMNMCFVAGKSAQFASWVASGLVPWSFWLSTVPLMAVPLVSLFAGERIRRRIDTGVYMGWLRKFLWVMTVLLVVQFVRAVA